MIVLGTEEYSYWFWQNNVLGPVGIQIRLESDWICRDVLDYLMFMTITDQYWTSYRSLISATFKGKVLWGQFTKRDHNVSVQVECHHLIVSLDLAPRNFGKRTSQNLKQPFPCLLISSKHSLYFRSHSLRESYIGLFLFSFLSCIVSSILKIFLNNCETWATL